MKKKFRWSDYKWCNGSDTTLTKYNTKSSNGIVDNLTTLEQVDDAAYQSDNICRMPTKADLEELTANTKSIWETLNGVKGRRFTSKINSNSIFIPAAGYCYNGSVLYVGSFGYVWSSSLDESTPRISWYMNFSNTGVSSVYYGQRCNGFPIRPVKSN